MASNLDLERRMRSLERQNRLLAFVLLLGLALFLMGQKSPGSALTTEKLRLVDAQGRPRANFFVEGEEVYLILGESSGKSRIALRVKDQGEASLVLAGSNGEPRATLQCAADGTVRRTP